MIELKCNLTISVRQTVSSVFIFLLFSFRLSFFFFFILWAYVCVCRIFEKKRKKLFISCHAIHCIAVFSSPKSCCIQIVSIILNRTYTVPYRIDHNRHSSCQFIDCNRGLDTIFLPNINFSNIHLSLSCRSDVHCTQNALMLFLPFNSMIFIILWIANIVTHVFLFICVHIKQNSHAHS